MLSLYDPAWLKGEWDRLELAYGPKDLKRAQGYAKIVYEENDPQVVEDIIKMTNAFGEEKVKRRLT